MSDTLKTVIVAAVVALIVSGIVMLSGGSHSSKLGTIGQGITNLTGLSITGNHGTLDDSATTTFGSAVNEHNPVLCHNLYATSSATILHEVASTTGALPHGAAAVVTLNYGACTN